MQRSRQLERLREKPDGFEPKRSMTKNGSAPTTSHPNPCVPRALVNLHSAADVDDVFSALRRVLRERVRHSFLAFLLRGQENDREVVLRAAGHPQRSHAESLALVERAGELRQRSKQRLIRLSEPTDGDRFAASDTRRSSARGRTFPALVMGFDGCGYAQALLLVARGRTDDDFTIDDLRGLAELQRHITTALRGVRALQRERVTRLALQKLLSRFPVGVVVLDWEKRVLYRNTAATELCALWHHGEVGRSLNASRVFRVPKEVVRACQSIESEASSISVLSPEEPRVRAVVERVHFEPELLGRPRFLVHFEAVSGRRGTNAGPNRMDLLLRLTPRERELVDVVGRGVSNADAARRLGKSVHTVKKQLQGIYRKFGVKNRARLVALFSREAR